MVGWRASHLNQEVVREEWDAAFVKGRKVTDLANSLSRRAFLKGLELKNKRYGCHGDRGTGVEPPWCLSANSYAEIEAKRSEKENPADAT